jgi:hypothetical protein
MPADNGIRNIGNPVASGWATVAISLGLDPSLASLGVWFLSSPDISHLIIFTSKTMSILGPAKRVSYVHASTIHPPTIDLAPGWAPPQFSMPCLRSRQDLTLTQGSSWSYALFPKSLLCSGLRHLDFLPPFPRIVGSSDGHEYRDLDEVEQIRCPPSEATILGSMIRRFYNTVPIFHRMAIGRNPKVEITCSKRHHPSRQRLKEGDRNSFEQRTEYTT